MSVYLSYHIKMIVPHMSIYLVYPIAIFISSNTAARAESVKGLGTKWFEIDPAHAA
jgi:hypothetical protein